MIGFNGGLIGGFRDTTNGTSSVPGVWTANEQVVARKKGLWPGPDPFFSSVSLLLPGDGTNGSTSIIDRSPSPKTITVVGNAQISTAQSKFGGSSIAFDGSGDYLSVPYNLSLALGSENFTVESWIYKNVHKTGMVVCGTMTTQSPFDTKWQMFGDVTNGRKLIISTEMFILTSTSDLATGQWHHVAWARSSSTSRLFINGILEASSNDTRNYSATNDLWIGQVPENVSTRFWDGFIDDLRITKGVAHYTANFTPPTAPHPTF